MKIILDTNFIISCLRNNIQLFDEAYNFIVPYEVIDELKKIKENKESKIKDREASILALELIKKSKVEKVRLGGDDEYDVDFGIIKLAKEKGYVVASLDKELRRRSVRGGGSVRFMIIKNKKKLEIV